MEMVRRSFTAGKPAQPYEEPGEFATGPLGDKARVVEVIEEQPRQRAMYRPSPPVIGDGDNAVVVGGSRSPERDVSCHDDGSYVRICQRCTQAMPDLALTCRRGYPRSRQVITDHGTAHVEVG